MNFREKATCAHMLTHKGQNNTTAACMLCKGWVSACAVPSETAQLKVCLVMHIRAPGGATFWGINKRKRPLSMSRCEDVRLNFLVS